MPPVNRTRAGVLRILSTVFKMISDLTGSSIIMSPAVSKQPPRINIWIKNLTPQQVLDQVAVIGGLALEQKGNTIKVMTFEEYSRIYGVEKRVVTLVYANAKEVVNILKPFVAKEDQARIIPDESGNKVVLLVPKPLIDSLAKLIKAVDLPYENDVVEILKLQHQEALALVPALEEFLTEQVKGVERSSQSKATIKIPTDGIPLRRAGDRWLVSFMVEPALNVIVMRGLAKDIAQVIKLVQALDIQTNVKVKSYEVQFTNVLDVFETLETIVKEELQLHGKSGSRGGMLPRFRLSVSEQNNRIIVEGSTRDHQRVLSIIRAIDKPIPPGTGGIRVYRLENASAEEVATVLKDLIEDQVRGGKEQHAKQERSQKAGTKNAKTTKAATGASPRPKDSHLSSGDERQLSAGDILPPKISTAPEINAVIIRASYVEHEEFARIIEELDRPRDQVVLEVTLVTVRSDKSLDLGVDVGFGLRKFGSSDGEPIQQTGFTTFGVGAVDAETGAVRLASPAFGLNYSIFNIKDLSLVLRALKTVGDVRIASVPKILVENNADAYISQFNQEPYDTTSQGEDSTITSFGGFIDAGTELIVKPHIAEAGWLRLKYSISLSSFGTRNAQQEAANLPPPRRQTKTSGTVRIPEEHVVVLGGVKTTRKDNTVDSVPFLSDIPWLGELFKYRAKNEVHETLFIFIHPVVLRDPKFRDLLYLSEVDIGMAKLDQAKYPENPLKMILTPTGKPEVTGK